MDELELLRASLADSLIVSKGEYQYFVHPLSDGVPLVEAAILDEAAAALLESVGVEEITSEGGFSTAQASGVSAAIDALAVQLAAAKATEDLRGQATVSSAVFELVLDLEAAAVAATDNEDTVGAIVISSLMDDALAVLDG